MGPSLPYIDWLETGAYLSGQKGRTVNPLALPSQVRILPRPFKPPSMRAALRSRPSKGVFAFPSTANVPHLQRRKENVEDRSLVSQAEELVTSFVQSHKNAVTADINKHWK